MSTKPPPPTPLRRWRVDRAEITQQEAADRLGISIARYCDIENGASCSLKVALAIEKLTGIAPRDLVRRGKAA